MAADKSENQIWYDCNLQTLAIIAYLKHVYTSSEDEINLPDWCMRTMRKHTIDSEIYTKDPIRRVHDKITLEYVVKLLNYLKKENSSMTSDYDRIKSSYTLSRCFIYTIVSFKPNVIIIRELYMKEMRRKYFKNLIHRH